MEKYRIGNDIKVKWVIFRNGKQPEDFTKATIQELRLNNVTSGDSLLPTYSVSGNVITVEYPAHQQKEAGVFTLTLKYTKKLSPTSTEDQYTIDKENAFEVVAQTRFEESDPEIPGVIESFVYRNRDGKDGSTPDIGKNENWWINGKDTGKPSRGRAFVSSDFTEAEWNELKKPSLDAAGVATDAAIRCEDAISTTNDVKASTIVVRDETSRVKLETNAVKLATEEIKNQTEESKNRCDESTSQSIAQTGNAQKAASEAISSSILATDAAGKFDKAIVQEYPTIEPTTKATVINAQDTFKKFKEQEGKMVQLEQELDINTNVKIAISKPVQAGEAIEEIMSDLNLVSGSKILVNLSITNKVGTFTVFFVNSKGEEQLETVSQGIDKIVELRIDAISIKIYYSGVGQGASITGFIQKLNTDIIKLNSGLSKLDSDIQGINSDIQGVNISLSSKLDKKKYYNDDNCIVIGDTPVVMQPNDFVSYVKDGQLVIEGAPVGKSFTNCTLGCYRQWSFDPREYKSLYNSLFNDGKLYSGRIDNSYVKNLQVLYKKYDFTGSNTNDFEGSVTFGADGIVINKNCSFLNWSTFVSLEKETRLYVEFDVQDVVGTCKLEFIQTNDSGVNSISYYNTALVNGVNRVHMPDLPYPYGYFRLGFLTTSGSCVIKSISLGRCICTMNLDRAPIDNRWEDIFGRGIDIPNNVISKIDNNRYNSINALFIGDSLFENKELPNVIISELGISSYLNVAKSSATLCSVNNTDPYDGRPKDPTAGHANDNTIANQIYKIDRLRKGTDLDSGETIYTTKPNVIFIMAATNDGIFPDFTNTEMESSITVEKNNVYVDRSWNADGIGELGTVRVKVDLSTVDLTKCYGAYRFAVEKLQTWYPDAIICVLTPPINNHSPQSNCKCAEQIITICRRLSVPVIDVNANTKNELFDAPTGDGTQGNPYRVHAPGRYTVDGVHYSASGAVSTGKYVVNKAKVLLGLIQ